MGMIKFRAPALPLPRPDYDPQQTSELLRALRLYFNQLDSTTPREAESYTAGAFFGGEFSGSRFDGGILSGFGQGLQVPYAMFMSDEDQGSAGTTSENIVTLNQTIFSDGIAIEDDNRITFGYTGQYLVTVRFQFANRGNAAAEFEVWAKNSGVNYPLSNSRWDIAARKSESVYSHQVANISGIFTVVSGEYLQLAWWSDGADVYLESYAAGTSPTRPQISSVIMTVTFVSALPAKFVPTVTARLAFAGVAPTVTIA